MTFTGILTVVWYSALPWLWLVALMLVVLGAAQLIARFNGYSCRQSWRWSQSGMGAKYLPPLVAVLAVFLVPLHTQSSLANVNTWVDWLNLFGAAIGLGVYAWLVLHPLCYLRAKKSA